MLMHTGHPNPGVRKVIKEYGNTWAKIPVPVIVHLIGTTVEEVSRAAEMLNQTEAVAAIELGLNDDIKWREAEDLVIAATDHAEKPVLVRLPFYEAMGLAKACADAGADALVVAAPPRGTARDPRSGRLVSGRLYSPLIKPLVLRMVGSLCSRMNSVPIIGAGGVHSPQDARDYLEAGATAVQVDSVTWIKPTMIERIARDLSGKLVTSASGAFSDEWNPDMGDTTAKNLREGGSATPGTEKGGNETTAPDNDAPARKKP
jgi:dihydroorotate dehydrogenase (NAD+) catalytic subunit